MSRILCALLSTAAFGLVVACSSEQPAEQVAGAAACPENDTGIVLPPGFCATVFADNLGHTRHMAVGDDGTIYVNSWSGSYFRGRDPVPAGGYLIALRDEDGDGKAESIVRFGPKSEEGATGGMGIALFDGGLYAEAGPNIVRYQLTPGNPVPQGSASVILSGLATDGDHNMHPIAIDGDGNLFVNMGSASNACQVADRQPESPGRNPCIELQTRGGLWRYDSRKEKQAFSTKERYATGLRNAGGLTVDAQGRLFATQHGRDQLSQNWPKLFTIDQGAELPAEQLMQVQEGSDFGWPYCYYDGPAGQLKLAPEYGGDGQMQGLCADKDPGTAAFPAHIAPMAISFYYGNQFPTVYQNGVFIAFHGSWNRAPNPQAGYNVWFQPMADGKASGSPIIFADGFAGGILNPGQSKFRPAGLAVGKDGALYVADDAKGRIWRITYSGNNAASLTAAPPPPTVERQQEELPPPPPGFTAAQLALGRSIYLGQAKDGTCAGCHGEDARGTSVGPTLVSGNWLHGDGSIEGITKSIVEGVAKPRNFTNSVMPPNGGADLTSDDAKAIAAYLFALNQAGNE